MDDSVEDTHNIYTGLMQMVDSNPLSRNNTNARPSIKSKRGTQNNTLQLQLSKEMDDSQNYNPSLAAYQEVDEDTFQFENQDFDQFIKMQSGGEFAVHEDQNNQIYNIPPAHMTSLASSQQFMDRSKSEQNSSFQENSLDFKIKLRKQVPQY